MFHVVISSDSLSLPRPWRQNAPDEDADKFTRFIDTYPYLLERSLAKAMPKTEVRVTNYGTRGSTLGGAYSHRLELFRWMDADVGVVHRGIVDCWPRVDMGGAPLTSLEKFSADWKMLLDSRAEVRPGAPFVVVGVSPATGRILDRYPDVNGIIAGYNAILSADLDDNMRFVDMAALVDEHGGAIHHPDGQHLSPFGHARVAEALEEHVRSLTGLKARRTPRRRTPVLPAALNATQVLAEVRALRTGGVRARWDYLRQHRGVIRNSHDLALEYAQIAVVRNDLEGAEWALEQMPADVAPFQREFAQADILIAKGQPGEALTLLEGVAEHALDPAMEKRVHGDLWRWRTQAYLRLDMAQDAIEAAERWTEVRGDAFVPYRLLARAFRDAGRLELAEHFYRQVVHRGHDDVQLGIELAEVLSTRGRHDEALALIAPMTIESPSLRKRVEDLRAGAPAAAEAA